MSSTTRTLDAHAYLGSNPLWGRTGLPVPFDGAAWVKAMDRLGVDGMFVAPPLSGAAQDFKPDMELIARAVKEYPGRFFGYARPKPGRGKVAIDELRHWVKERGFRGVKLNVRDEGYSLTNRDLIDPVVQEADRLGVPVLMHTGGNEGAACTPSMVAQVALDFPGTTFIIGHMGWPGWSEELVSAMRRAPNTVTETALVNRLNVVQEAVDQVGASRVLMGSNAPYCPIEATLVMLRGNMPQLSRAESEAILGRNLMRLLRIEG